MRGEAEAPSVGSTVPSAVDGDDSDDVLVFLLVIGASEGAPSFTGVVFGHIGSPST